MKKFFTLFAVAALAVSAYATDSFTYALNVDDTFTSGETVQVKDGDTQIATLTFGEAGGNAFNAAVADNHVDGFTAYTSGNGTNGNKPQGTFYTIVPANDGYITVAVVLNADKAFYVEEDGTALAAYNGITVAEKYYGPYQFAVTAGKSYKVYCAGSKLGFYGFTYSITATGLDNVAAVAAEAPAYNLLGQKVDASFKGIVIKNGKKMLQK